MQILLKKSHDHSVESDLSNGNYAQPVVYLFLLMLYKASPCKIF